MKTLKKLFSVSAIVALLGTLAPMYAFGANYSDEEKEAYAYAKEHGITTMATIDAANMNGDLDRIAMAKMIANYAIDVLGLEPDTTKTCTFPDVTAQMDADYDNGVTKACQLGLMGVGITNFNPKGKVTRAQFGTAFSRALNNGSSKLEEMNAATPYYKEHLAYLNQEGIMKNISNPEMTERRGWVMLMMMRADENYAGNNNLCSNNELKQCIANALTDPSSVSSCIAACSGNDDEEERSGDLTVKATAADGKKVVLDGATSDTDTITLSANEKITLNSVTLERYGYSSIADIDAIWLENENGEQITAEKSFTSKDTVTLPIKKEYRNLKSTDTFTVVVRTTKFYGTCNDDTIDEEDECVDTYDHDNDAGTPEVDRVWTIIPGYYGTLTTDKAGTTIGFKVTAVESSAKTLNLKNYTPFQYDMVIYNGTQVRVQNKQTTAKSYNYAAGESYEVAKYKVTAGNAPVEIKGFTLTNAGTIDLDDFADDIEVLVDGQKVTGLTSNIKDDKLTLAFDAKSLEINKSATFTVKLKLVDFDEYGNTIILGFENDSDINAIESKNKTRVTINGAVTPATYTFNGGKVTLTNEKLNSTIDIAQGGKDSIAKGKIALGGGETIKIKTLTITPNKPAAVSRLALVVDGEEYEANASWTMKNILVEKDSDVEVVVELEDIETYKGQEITFTPAVLNATNLNVAGDNVIYDGAKTSVAESNFVGSIALSKVKVQESRGALDNELTDTVSFKAGQTTSKVVFSGTYTAKKQDVYLNNVAMVISADKTMSSDINFDVDVNGVSKKLEPGFLTTQADDEDYSDTILVKKGESVNVVVTANVYADNADLNKTLDYTLTLKGLDEYNSDAGLASEDTVTMKIVPADSINVSTSTSIKKDDVILSDKNQNIAKFVVKPGNNANEAELESLVFDVTDYAAGVTADNVDDYFLVKVDGTSVLSESLSYAANTLTVDNIKEDIVKSGAIVELIYKKDIAASDTAKVITLSKVNGTSITGRTFSRLVTNSIVRVVAQTGDNASMTKYTFSVNYANSYEGNRTIKSVKFTYDNADTKTFTNVDDGAELSVSNIDDVRYLEEIEYVIDVDGDPSNDETVTIDKATFDDYFKIGNDEIVSFSK